MQRVESVRTCDVFTGTIETKGAHAMRDLQENELSVVGRHCHLSIIDVVSTDAKLGIKQQGPGPLMHDVNPQLVEV